MICSPAEGAADGEAVVGLEVGASVASADVGEDVAPVVGEAVGAAVEANVEVAEDVGDAVRAAGVGEEDGEEEKEGLASAAGRGSAAIKPAVLPPPEYSSGMMHGASSVSLPQYFLVDLIPEPQQSAQPRPAAEPDEEHPFPPHWLHAIGQQTASLALIPGISSPIQ